MAVVSGVCFWVGSLYVSGQRESPLSSAVDLVLGLVCVVLIAFDDAIPLVIGVMVAALGAFSRPERPPWSSVSLATRRRWREIIPADVVTLVASVVYLVIRPGCTKLTLCSAGCSSPSS